MKTLVILPPLDPRYGGLSTHAIFILNNYYQLDCNVTLVSFYPKALNYFNPSPRTSIKIFRSLFPYPFQLSLPFLYFLLFSKYDLIDIHGLWTSRYYLRKICF